ncbi:MAG: kynureninase [Ignavibacteria bacterium]|nr:kynureninase [Ignavibacteria bacterium]
MNKSTLMSKAEGLDAEDKLSRFRDLFSIPTINNNQVLYFCGNSLGLMPKSATEYLSRETADWSMLGVAGHHEASSPWLSYHRMFAKPLSKIVGALPSEVVAMNSLTVNLHLMMVSFYRPTTTRNKILIVGQEFPSDRYAAASQILFHGFDPQHSLIEAMPEPGSQIIEESHIESILAEHADSIAMVLISGVHYYSGQRFDIERICKAAHNAGATFGVDLAHAVGNVELKLHDWNVDFAVWCSYKYLNSGPGGVGGAFVHQQHAANPSLPRFAGWWGNDEASRFQMEYDFSAANGADGWQLSNAPILSMAAHKASLDIFDQVEMVDIFRKRDQLTQFFFDVICSIADEFDFVSIVSHADPQRRGAQISIRFEKQGKEIFNRLAEQGVVVDWRNPSVIRVAPAPLYNSYTDVAKFGILLHEILEDLRN